LGVSGGGRYGAGIRYTQQQVTYPGAALTPLSLSHLLA